MTDAANHGQAARKPPDQAINEAVALAGSQNALARKCDLPPVDVWRSVRAGRATPRVALAIASGTDGAVRLRDLIPEIYDACVKEAKL